MKIVKEWLKIYTNPYSREPEVVLCDILYKDNGEDTLIVIAKTDFLAKPYRLYHERSGEMLSTDGYKTKKEAIAAVQKMLEE